MALPALTALPRSFLYVPADRPELFPKASAGPADALIFDLEDAVPLHRKEQARVRVHQWLAAEKATEHPVRPRGCEPQCWVRISAETIAEDLGAAVTTGLAGIFLAKCTPASLRAASDLLADLEASCGLPQESIGIIGLVESAEALLQLDVMARCDRLLTFAIGEVDLMADLRMKRGADSEPALDSIRLRIVIACAAAKLAPPVAPTSTEIREPDAFRQSSYKMHALGFRSRTAVHPSQVPVIHDAFTPGADEVAAASEVLERFRQADGGIAIDQHGRMIDAAVVRGAEETLHRSLPGS